MKFLSLIFLTVLLGKGCDSAQEQDLANAVVEYSANTRGFFYKITIQNKKVEITRDRRGQNKPATLTMSDADWNELVAEFKTVNLDGLSTLKAPTELRFHDGAAMANLKVTYKEKEYTSSEFDDGHPPAEIEKLVNRITKYKPTRE
ncbi:MAG: hypothetical protein EOO50_03915 [Flavobacterium sp.]|uniref:hypothetical protein n=1 Tax=Flavobacterium sp. TaxID=239 RepID=UPI00121654A7|nr:hypothetical protein [Flavobacterium sp.]RZJ67981.1 MAG: hypothetical protein EOO50_03915 [Flavobacterium sp.]